MRYKCDKRRETIKIVSSARHPMTQSQLALKDEQRENDFVNAYWCVRVTQDKAKANMIPGTRNMSAGKVKKVPTMVNAKALAADEELLVYAEDIGHETEVVEGAKARKRKAIAEPSRAPLAPKKRVGPRR